MKQQIAWGAVITGGVTFLFQMAEILRSHSTWSELASPASTADILVASASLLAAVGGAIFVTVNGKKDEPK